MSVAKLSTGTGGTLDSMKSGDGNESPDTFIRQTVGKEPLLSFSRAGDSPVQWIQLLHALDQPELPGWPLLTPLKVQMQKCEKCAREFCSLVNYRRHIRVHRRSLNVDKESHKIRDMLAAFWDKLSLEKAEEVVSLNDVALKEVPGSSVIRALAASIRKPGVWTLPQVYVKAGSTLLDIIHAKPSRLPISSLELFSILDDASERTFLCAGTAESVQKYVFDGEAGKVALELKNLVACTGFLLEQKLVKAWLTDKDVEALRCQKLLVEEEEAAQKRQAELLERKKQKKLRQKEHKAREQSNAEKVALTISSDSLEGSLEEETCSPQSPSDSYCDAPYILADVTSCLEPVQVLNFEENDDIEAQFDLNSEHLETSIVQNVEPAMVPVNVRRRWQVPKSQRVGKNGFHGNENLQVLKFEPVQKHGPAKDRGTVVSSSKVWTKKFKVEDDDESLRPRLEEAVNQTYENKCELIIGSVSVPVKNCISWRKEKISFGEAQHSDSTEPGKHKKINALEEPANSDNLHGAVSRAATKLWRPVSRSEMRGPAPVQRAHHDSLEAAVLEKLEDRTASDGSCLQSSASDDEHSKTRECLISLYEGTTLPQGLELSSVAAKAFLAQRWKEAISSEHVKLVLSTESEPPGCPQTRNDFSTFAALASYSHESSVSVDFDNRQLDGGHSSSTSRNGRAKIITNPEKGVKIKYIPKQKVAA